MVRYKFSCFVSRVGFKNNPISFGDWVAAAESLDDYWCIKQRTERVKLLVLPSLNWIKRNVLA